MKSKMLYIEVAAFFLCGFFKTFTSILIRLTPEGELLGLELDCMDGLSP
jgi:hypothetical protein